MANGVHLAMKRMQPTGGGAVADCATAEAKTEKLCARDHSVLAFGDLRHSSIAETWVAWCTQVVRKTTHVHHRGKFTGWGLTRGARSVAIGCRSYTRA
jgi:hypothetical protein